MTVTPAPVTVTLTPFEARLVFLINQARAGQGEQALVVVAGATDVARRWALQLAGDDDLSHNPMITQDLQAAGSPDWTFIAENVGSGDAGDADGLFAAYLASPHHRENILDPRAVELGIGAVTTPEPEGDTTFNTMDFVDSYNDSYGATETNPVAAELPLAGLLAAQG